MLKRITLLRDRVSEWETYPFCVPAIRGLGELDLRSRICFFAGENGTEKSTLLEAIAVHYGFGREGGTRNFTNNTTESNHSIDPLVKALRLSFDKRTGAGFFLRAESWFNAVSYMDNLGLRNRLRLVPSTAGEACTPDPMERRFLRFLNLSSSVMACSCWTNPKRRSRHNVS